MTKTENNKNLPALKDSEEPFLTKEYTAILASLKKQVVECQIKAATAANKELIKLYWNIGKIIADKQKKNGWGTGFIEKLAHDFQNEFPDIEGFSGANIFRMKAYFLAYEKVAQATRQFESIPTFNFPWGHNIILLQKLYQRS